MDKVMRNISIKIPIKKQAIPIIRNCLSTGNPRSFVTYATGSTYFFFHAQPFYIDRLNTDHFNLSMLHMYLNLFKKSV